MSVPPTPISNCEGAQERDIDMVNHGHSEANSGSTEMRALAQSLGAAHNVSFNALTPFVICVSYESCKA